MISEKLLKRSQQIHETMRLAETWQLRSGTAKNEAATTANEKFQLANLTLPTSVDIPDNNPAGINQTLKITQGINIL